MLVCFYHVLSAHALPTYALLEGPQDSLIQGGLEHKIVERTLLALLSRMARLKERPIPETPLNFSGHHLMAAERQDVNLYRHQGW